MRIPKFILEPIANWLITALDTGKLAPHPEGDLGDYMRRGVLISGKWTFGWQVRVHHTRRSDSDRHLHDHPGHNISVILRNWYYEIMPTDNSPDALPQWIAEDRELTSSQRRMPGDVVFRRASARHRLVIPGELQGPGCYSLFVMGPRFRRWGFTTPTGWVFWKDYLGINNGRMQ